MANVHRIKRRSSGSPGAPSSLANAEIAFNEVDDILYYGKGNSGGNAVTIEAIGGKGAFVPSAGDSTIAGNKTFSSPVTVGAPSAGSHAATKTYVDGAVGAAGGGDMMKSVYDPTNVNGSAFARANHTGSQATSTITGLDAALSAKAALASPAFTGTPTAPTATQGTNNTQIATTAYVRTAVSALVDSAPGTLDTLKELADALGGDANFASTVTSQIGGKQNAHASLTSISGLTTVADRMIYTTGSNVYAVTVLTSFGRSLLDDVDAAAGRTTLGLGSIATQAASSVAITGGSISGVTLDVTIDCGTF